MFHVVINDHIPMSAWHFLTSQGFKVTQTNHAKEIEEALQSADALISVLSFKLDREFFLKFPNIKVVSNFAVGTNNIDLNAAKEFGVKIGNTPDVLTEATANLALGLMLDVSRNIRLSSQAAANGLWKKWEPLGYLGPSLEKKTLGILGMGKIGFNLAEKCFKAFEMKIIYHNRNEHSEAKAIQAQRVSIEDLFAQSDFISIHCPLNENSRLLVNKQLLSRCQKRPIIINTARGEIMDQEDLVEALKEGIILGAGLDVTSPEPLDPTHPLFSFPTVTITPHIGSATFEARDQMAILAAKNIYNGLNHLDMPSRIV